MKFKIVAYPSSEYGYFAGIIDTIAKDIKVDCNSGNCQAKIVAKEKSVLHDLVEKINLLD